MSESPYIPMYIFSKPTSGCRLGKTETMEREQGMQ